MSFDVTGTKVTIQGYLSLSKTPVSLKTMWKAFREQGERLLLELGSIIVGPNLSPPQPSAFIMEVLDEFE